MEFYRKTAEALWSDIKGRGSFDKIAAQISDEVKERLLDAWSRILFEQDLARFLERRKLPELLARQISIATIAAIARLED